MLHYTKKINVRNDAANPFIAMCLRADTAQTAEKYCYQQAIPSYRVEVERMVVSDSPMYVPYDLFAPLNAIN